MNAPRTPALLPPPRRHHASRRAWRSTTPGAPIRSLAAVALLAPWALSAAPAAADEPVPPHVVQGRSHVSPLVDQQVTVEGVVTVVGREGLVVIASLPGREDDDPATSEGLFVQLAEDHGLAVGQHVVLAGRVVERRPGGRDSNLSVTRLEDVGRVEVRGEAVPLPAPVVLGVEGRPAPSGVIDDDSQGHVEQPPVHFDPDQDALDWAESLEGMRVVIPAPVVVGSTTRYGEVVVLADGGTGNRSLGADGALVIAPGDANPERLTVDDMWTPVPEVTLGARFAGPLTGIMAYDWGTYRVWLSEPAPAAAGGRTRDRIDPAPEGALRIVSYNVENLSAADPAWRFQRIAEQIVHDLGSPDVLALQEIQDGSGPADDGVVSAAGTFAALQRALDEAGGPTYEAFEVAPADGADGGQPGGNIRVAFLVRSDGELDVVRRGDARADTPTRVGDDDGRPVLSHSPGRIEPGHAAWENSRKPLALECRWRGEPLFLVNNHWASKRGDDGMFGPVQPPVRHSEGPRTGQGAVIARFVEDLLEVDPMTRVVVAGDLNEFGWRPPVQRLTATGLIDLVESLPPTARWSYVYQGNAQVLDHVLVSPGLVDAADLEFAIAHLNAAWVDGASDHDPLVLTLSPR